MLGDVPGQKKLDRKHAEHLAAILRPICRDRFDDNQTAFAKAVGVSQSQMNAILSATGDRSVGINVLIRIREYLGTLTLDEMLNLPTLTRRETEQSAFEIAVERALDRRFPQAAPPLLGPAPDVATPKKRRGPD